MKIQPKLELASLSFNDLDNYAQDKVDILEGNTDFPQVQPTIEKLKPILEDYIKLLGNTNPSKSDTEIKKNTRKALEELLTKAATYCVLEADGNLGKFLSSGFDAKGAKTASQPLPKPTSFSFSASDNAGEALATLAPIPGNKGYSFAWTVDPISPTSVWNVIPFPKRQYNFAGLPSGSRVWVKAGALSSDGTINYSDPICRGIQ